MAMSFETEKGRDGLRNIRSDVFAVVNDYI